MNFLNRETSSTYIPNETANAFTILSIPINFFLDQSLLEKNYKHLIQETHPDRAINKTDIEKIAFEKMSMGINQAYKKLKDPLLRAKEMLIIKKPNANLEETTNDPIFLMEMMEYHEKLEHGTPCEILENFICVQNEIQRYANAFQEAFENNTVHILENIYKNLCYLLKLEKQFTETLKKEQTKVISCYCNL